MFSSVIFLAIVMSLAACRQSECDIYQLGAARNSTTYSSSRSFSILRSNEFSSPVVDHSNWNEIFTQLCWFRQPIFEPNSNLTCRLTDGGDECTIMDLLLSTRHYHPKLGKSHWKSKYLEDSVDRSTNKLVDSTMLTVSNINLVTPKEVQLYLESIWKSMPQHQRFGIKGLVSILLLLLVMILIGFLLHPYECRQSLRMAFDYRQHWNWIFSLPSHDNINMFSFFDGIRALSMFWVMAGHSLVYWSTFLPFSSSSIVFDIVKDPLNYPQVAAIFAVDNFFFLSGVLTGLIFKESLIKTVDKKKSANYLIGPKFSSLRDRTTRQLSRIKRSLMFVFLTIIRRYCRLIGLHSVVLFSYLAINWQTMILPAGSRYLQSTNIACAEVAPSLLMLVNNLIHGEFVNECFGWTWYLSNEFQFFLTGLLIVIISLFYSSLSWLFIILLLFGCISLSISICLKYQLGFTVDRFPSSYLNAAYYIHNRQYLPMHPIMDYFYVKSYVRIAPYLIGISLGLILLQCKNRNSSGTDNTNGAEKSNVGDQRKELKDCIWCRPVLPGDSIQSRNETNSKIRSNMETGAANKKGYLNNGLSNNITDNTIYNLPLVVQHLLNQYYSLLFIITFSIPVIIVFGGHAANHCSTEYWTPRVDACFLAISRLLWGLFLGGLTFMIVFSPNKIISIYSSFYHSIISSIKSFLSCPYWTPISRISYSMYLSHPIVLFGFYGNGFGPESFIRGSLFYCYIINILISFCCAVLLSVFIEIPIRHITCGFFKFITAS